MNYVNYGRGRSDMNFTRVRFDSFVDLNNWVKSQDELKHGVTLRFNGTTTCGDVEIELSVNQSYKKGLILEKAAELLKFL